MSTLPSQSTFADVAEVLHAAVTLGRAAWGRDIQRRIDRIDRAKQK